MNKRTKVVLGVVTFGVVMMVVIGSLLPEESKGETVLKTIVEPIDPVYVTASQLYADYTRPGGNAKYKGKVLVVTGRITETFGDNRVVMSSSSIPSMGVECEGDLSELSIGDVVSLRGIGDGKFFVQVYVKDCSIEVR